MSGNPLFQLKISNLSAQKTAFSGSPSPSHPYRSTTNDTAIQHTENLDRQGRPDQFACKVTVFRMCRTHGLGWRHMSMAWDDVTEGEAGQNSVPFMGRYN